MKLEDRLANLDANLDDLQAGLEACARTAELLHTDALKFNDILKRIKNAPVIGSLVKRAAELQACARDQRVALRELRDGIMRVHEELKRANGAVRPPPAIAADESRR